MATLRQKGCNRSRLLFGVPTQTDLAPPSGSNDGARRYAGHKDPRTTGRYDHSRDSLDRNAAYAVAAYLA